MIPFTFPSQPSVVSGNAECKVWYLSSVVGMARWIDYIPVRQTATASPIEGRTDAGGYQAVTLLSSISGLAAWTDYIPVYEDSSATVAWGTGADGYIPVGAAGAALSLQMLGSNTLDPRITFTRASSGTHFDSTGRLVTDGNNVARFDYDPAVPAGVTGGELVTNGTFASDAANWTANTGSLSVVGGRLRVSGASAFGAAIQTLALTVGKRYLLTVVVGTSTAGAANVRVRVGTAPLDGSMLDATPSADGATVTATIIATTSAPIISLMDRTADAITYAEFVSASIQELTFTPRGLLIEEQRTNLLLHSRDMTQAAWSKTDVTAARTQVGIDGVASSACLMTEGSAGTAGTNQVSTVTAGSTITNSIVMKRGNTDWVRVSANESTGTDGCNAWFNLNTGTKGAVTVFGAGTNASSTITNLGGGWYRCTVTCLPNGVYTNAQITFRSATADNVGTRVANATYIVDCAQLEVGAFATSPIITGAATATRAADSASMTGTNFSSWFNASAGTLVGEYLTLNPGTDRRLTTITESTANYIGHRVTTGNAVNGIYRVGASNFDVGNAGTLTAGILKQAIAYGPSDFASAYNGGAVATSVPTAIAPVTLHIGQGPGTSTFSNSWIRSLRYYNTRLPNATLTALTA